MKRDKLETYIGKKIKILLYDGSAYKGCLQKTNTEAVRHNESLIIMYCLTQEETLHHRSSGALMLQG